MHVVFLSRICILYIPTFVLPVSGCLVWTIGRVIKLPPSWGQHFKTGRIPRSGSLYICCWHLPILFIRDGRRPARFMREGIADSFCLLYTSDAADEEDSVD